MVLGNILKVKDRSLIIKNLNNTSDLNKNILRGLSGCPIVINRSGTITKYSSSREYNARLLRQAEKQIEFYSQRTERIKCPNVINIQKENIFSFEMEYVSGSNYLDFLGYASPEYIGFFVDSILGYLDNISGKDREKYTKDEFSILCYGKIQSLEEFSQYRNFFLYLGEKIKNIGYVCIDKTFCHGDLTFSNILFHKNRIFFLDFLDSYVDSFLCDIVKLKQDLYHMWSIKIQNIKSFLYKIFE